MARGPSSFKQRDVAAAIRAARQAGLEVAQVIVGRDGTIRVVTTKGAAATPANEWDSVLTQEKDED